MCTLPLIQLCLFVSRCLSFRKVVSVARSRTFREHQGKILLEGRRLICDALDAGAMPQMVFFSKADRLRELPLDKLKRATIIKVKFEDIKIWSDLVAPQGVIGEGHSLCFGSLSRRNFRDVVDFSLFFCSHILSAGSSPDGLFKKGSFSAIVPYM